MNHYNGSKVRGLVDCWSVSSWSVILNLICLCLNWEWALIIKTNLPRELVDHQNKLTERASRSSQQTYRESQSIITTNLPRQLVDHHNKLMDRVGRSSQQTYRESWSIITVSISFFFFFSASKSSCNRQKKNYPWNITNAIKLLSHFLGICT